MSKTATAGEPDPNDDMKESARDRALDALELPGRVYGMAATPMAIGDAYDYLHTLPGIDAPYAAGDCWRFVGVA